MSLVFTAPSKTLSSDPPDLMPFHIDYTGPAPISTYFLVKETTPASTATAHIESSSEIPLELKMTTGKRTFQAAFRGRLMHAANILLPRGYTGLSLHVSGAASSSAEDKSNALKRARDGSPSKSSKGSKRAKETNAVASGSGRRTRSGRATAAREAPEPEQTMDTEEDVYAMMSEVVIEEDSQATLVDEGTSSGPQEDAQVQRDMKPIGTFDSINIWNPDVPLDENRDDYVRALDEWTRLAAVIHSTS